MRSKLAILAILSLGSSLAMVQAGGVGNRNRAAEPTGPAKPAPRTPDGHPDLNGFWKGTRDTIPTGNIAKDLPGLKLPLTPAGDAAWKHNTTATVDPEAICILGGIPRHNASGLPFQIIQSPKYV